MTGRIKIIRKTTSVVDGRRQQEEKEFFSCWCDVKSLNLTAFSSMTTSQSHSTGKPLHRSIKWVQETLRALWRYMQRVP